MVDEAALLYPSLIGLIIEKIEWNYTLYSNIDTGLGT